MPQLSRTDIHKSVISIWQTEESEEWFLSHIQLSQSEQNYLSGLQSISRRAEWLTSRYLVRLELGDRVSTDYIEGMPSLVGSNLHISISHSSNIVVVMFSKTICGIDIEDSRRNFIRVSERFLSTHERTHISAHQYSLAWGIKEAAYKLIGDKAIDFGSSFVINEINSELQSAIMRYNDSNYEFNYFWHRHYHIVFSK